MDGLIGTSSANLRTDAYGGPIKNPVRFLHEVVAAVAAEIGANRTGVRLSPNGDSQGVDDPDPETLFATVAETLSKLNIAFLELREPPADGTRGKPDPPPVHPMIGRHFRGPSLPHRLAENLPLTPDDMAPVYPRGEGYIDYPAA